MNNSEEFNVTQDFFIKERQQVLKNKNFMTKIKKERHFFFLVFFTFFVIKFLFFKIIKIPT